MALIGELAVNVVAKTAGLVRGLGRATKQVSRFDKRIAKVTRTFKKFQGAIGLAGGIGSGAIILSLKKTADSIDRIAKASEKLGIATENLVGLELAASRTGVSVQQLEMGMQRMVRRVSEAASGTGEAQAAIKELGLSASSLNRLAPDQQLRRIADAFRNVRGEADKVRLAFKLFDSEGVNLVRLLNTGAAGLNAFQKEAEALGLTFSKEKAAEIERFEDALGRLMDVTRVLGRKIIIDVAPAAADLIEGLSALIRIAPGLLGDPQKLGRAARHKRQLEERGFTVVRRGGLTARETKRGKELAEELIREGLAPAGIGPAPTHRVLGKISEAVRGMTGAIKDFKPNLQINELRKALLKSSFIGLFNKVFPKPIEEKKIAEKPQQERALNAILDSRTVEGFLALRENFRKGTEDKILETNEKQLDVQEELLAETKRHNSTVASPQLVTITA